MGDADGTEKIEVKFKTGQKIYNQFGIESTNDYKKNKNKFFLNTTLPHIIRTTMGKRNTFFHVTFSEPVTKAGSGSTLDHDNFADSFSSSTTVE